MGLSGSGKTTLAIELAKKLSAVHFNADAVRFHINKDLGFTLADRVEQSKRMGWLCDQVVIAGGYAIADFICPTVATREAFGDAYIVWVDRVKTSLFQDTNKMFQPPEHYNVRVPEEGSAEYWSSIIAVDVKPTFDSKKPTALFIGRWQPFHDGHKALVEEGIKRVGQVCIGVRDTKGIDDKNPFNFMEIKNRIEKRLSQFDGKFVVIQVPNITKIYYGRDVGYGIERIELPEVIEKISGTEIRKMKTKLSLI